MKNILKSILSLSIFALTLISCSSDDSPSPLPAAQFTVDWVVYTLPESNGLAGLDFFRYDNQSVIIRKSNITIQGFNGQNTAVVIFALEYKDGLPVEGTYNINNEDVLSDSYDDQLQGENRVCTREESFVLVNSIQRRGTMPSSNATVTVINNGNSNYTIQFNGAFKEIDSDDNIVGTMPVEISITNNLVSN